MAATFEFLGNPSKLLDPASFGKTLAIMQEGTAAPQKLYVSSKTIAYDETQLPGTSFDVVFLEDIPVDDGGGGGETFTGTITVLSVGE